MLNLLLNKLNIIANIRRIKSHKIMSKHVLSALIASESTRNQDHDADPASINKTIKEIRKKNRDEGKILKDLDFTFDPGKHLYEPEKTDSGFNNNYIQYESIVDQDKALLPKGYLDVIRLYLSHMINNDQTQGKRKIHSENIITNHKTHGGSKIHLTMAINFISFKDSDKTHIMDRKSDNIEIMMGGETDEIIEEFFESLFEKDIKKD